MFLTRFLSTAAAGLFAEHRQVQPFFAHKPLIREAVSIERKVTLIRKIQQSGEKVDQCPETNSEDSAQPCQFLKGEKK